MASAKAGVHVVQLKPITVSERLLEGYKFIKWDDVSTFDGTSWRCCDSCPYCLACRSRDSRRGLEHCSGNFAVFQK